ncbi:MAG: ribonuclease E/G, partial [Halothece sp.]
PKIKLRSTQEPKEEEEQQRETPTPERREKPSFVRSRRDTPELEEVTIEMSPEEQDVYALMGISPILRLEKNVNPKGVIVAVKPASQAESTDEAVEEETVDEEQEPIEEKTVEEKTVEEETVNAEIEEEDSLEDEESESNRPIIRRRRRRSSAREGANV